MARLRRETEALHRRIEGVVPLLDPGVTALDYRAHLVKLYGFQAPVERALDAVPELDAALPDRAERSKTPLLVRDLCALGMSAEELAALPLCTALPALPDGAAALGCLYVLEGASLGGQVLLRHLARRLPAEIAAASAYLSGGGADVGARWRRFGAAVEAYSCSEGRAERLVAAACDTFGRLHDWYICAGPSAPEAL